MVMWRFRVPLIRVEASLRLSDLMYHTKQKTEVIFMPDKVYRTAIYCRLSREDGDKVESNSIASQRAICEDYIANMRIWSWSVSRLWMTVTAALPSIVLSSKSWKRQSARVRLTAL